MSNGEQDKSAQPPGPIASGGDSAPLADGIKELESEAAGIEKEIESRGAPDPSELLSDEELMVSNEQRSSEVTTFQSFAEQGMANVIAESATLSQTAAGAVAGDAMAGGLLTMVEAMRDGASGGKGKSKTKTTRKPDGSIVTEEDDDDDVSVYENVPRDPGALSTGKQTKADNAKRAELKSGPDVSNADAFRAGRTTKSEDSTETANRKNRDRMRQARHEAEAEDAEKAALYARLEKARMAAEAAKRRMVEENTPNPMRLDPPGYEGTRRKKDQDERS